MRRIKSYIKTHPKLMEIFYFIAKDVFDVLSRVIPIKKKTMIFASLSGRNFDDSPKALYEEICRRPFFNDWTLIWAFKNPEAMKIPRGKKIKFGTLSYWFILMRTQVWIENGGMDLGLQLNYKGHIMVKTWHGTVIKRGEGDEATGAVLKEYRKKVKKDSTSIRCVQTASEIENCMKYFRADRKCFLKCGLPRNDVLVRYSEADKARIKEQLGIPYDKKIILYMPTYREYLLNENKETYILPPITLSKWKQRLGEGYFLLIRAHYGVAEKLGLDLTSFGLDVSRYQPLSELYYISDILISDYSSAFFDYSITGKPMRCFAYDYEEYVRKRGLLYDLNSILPCPVMHTEDEIIESILTMDYDLECIKTKNFSDKYAEFFSGHASEIMIDELEKRLQDK